MKTRTRAVTLVALSAVALMLASCDSTNRHSVGAAGDDSTQVQSDESAGPSASASAKPGTKPRPHASAGARTALPGQPSTTSGGASAPASPGGVTGTSTAPKDGKITLGPGVTASTIELGINLFKVGGYGKGIGLGQLSFGDTEAQANAVVNYINTHGGLDGKVIKPIYYTVDFGRTNGHDGQFEQEACAKWSQDNHVYAVINYAMARELLLTCLAKAGIPGVHMGMPVSSATLEKYKNYYWAGSGGPGLTLDRAAYVDTEVLGQRGWFGKDAVVGVEYYNDPEYKYVVDHVFVPQFKKFGAKKIVLQGAPRGGTNANPYVTKFKAAGVTRVFFIGEAGAYPQYFMQSAQNQQYFPKYALDSNMTAGVTLQSTVSKKQLVNATGIGWQPSNDVDANHDIESLGAAQDLCLDIMRKAGQDMSNRGARLTALTYCSGLFILRTALDGSHDLVQGHLMSQIEKIGSGFQSPITFGTFFDAKHHDGVSKYRIFDFPSTSFRYEGPVRQMPAFP